MYKYIFLFILYPGTEQTSKEFLEVYNDHLNQPRYHRFNPVATIAPGVPYDGIWSLALGLDNAIKRVAQGNESGCEELFGDLVPLEEFNYTNEKMGCILRKSINEVQFDGLSVSVV